MEEEQVVPVCFIFSWKVALGNSCIRKEMEWCSASASPSTDSLMMSSSLSTDILEGE